MASSRSLYPASSSSNHQWKFEVFLSFRGEDTRKSFTDHLHTMLTLYGINTFIDDQINRGEQVSAALLRKIEESRFSIVIFSQNYASSSWCLDELTKILECVKMGRHTTLPVFYKVDPSHVRHQRGSYADAFGKHEEVYKGNIEKVLKWREALAEVSGYSGWDTRNRFESEVIKEIAIKIFKEVNVPFSSSTRTLVGMDSCGKEVLSLLCLGLEDVLMTGIWGMPGIGKSTIAKFVYRQIYTQFEGRCFISNVREKSQDNIKKEVLSSILGKNDLSIEYSFEKVLSKKVLIVLDDVDHYKQLEDFIRNRNWFGQGSRIIITTRDESLLKKNNITKYAVKELEKGNAFRLFCLHAFKDELHKDDFVEFEELARGAVDYARGIPLALEILGSFLHKRSKRDWESELKKLKVIPNEEVQQAFMISFKGLDDNQRNIFLDIACFFKGEDKDYVSEILESCGFFPIGISILEEKALVTISNNNRLCMHDLIQEMGWEIVRQQSIDEPAKRSRLWSKEDVTDVLTRKIVHCQGMEAIQGVVLDLHASEEIDFNVEVFAAMIKLKVLRIRITPLAGSWQYFSMEDLLARYQLHLIGDFKFLSNNLRYLCWHKYPLKSLPSNFYPKNLFELNMSFSQLEELWKENKSFPRLKYIDLRYSQALIGTPDFSGAKELKRINLEGCTSLVKVHPSIGTLGNLSALKLKGCLKLEELPKSIRMLTSLQTLNLSGCSELKKLPDDMGTSLKTLNLSNCLKLEELPKCICDLVSLKTLCLSGCLGLEKLPNDMGSSIVTLNLSGCSKLKRLPHDIGSLHSLTSLVADGSGIQELPFSINLLTKLEIISLAGCKGGQPLSSSSLRQGLQLPSILHLWSLRTLNLSDCNLLEGALPANLSILCSLVNLDLSKNSFITLPSLAPLTKLRLLKLESCTSLQSLTKLPSSIRTTRAQNCKSLENFSHPPDSYAMWESGELQFDFSNCRRLLENDGSENLEAILQGIRVAAPSPVSQPLSKPRRIYNAVVAGSSIPEWFHQSMGQSITLELKPDFGDARPLGLAFCAVFCKNQEQTSGFCPFEYYAGNEFSTFAQYDVALGGSIHSSSEYDHIWFGYAPLPHNGGDKTGDDGDSTGDSGFHYRHRGISHLKVSFVGDDGLMQVVKRCGVRLLQEPDCREKPMMNAVIIEYDTVPAISCPPGEAFSDGHCWKGDLFVGNTGARLGLRIEVEGYDKNMVQEGKRSAQVPNPVPAAALMERKLDCTVVHVMPSSEEVQDILEQHRSFLLSEAGIVQGELVQRLEAAERLRLFVTNIMEENARLPSEPDSVSRDHIRPKGIDRLTRDFATSFPKEAYERVSKLTQDNEALQTQINQLLAERNNARVSGEQRSRWGWLLSLPIMLWQKRRCCASQCSNSSG